jgi:Bacteriocin-protection, YdeI or OmpD-Associated
MEAQMEHYRRAEGRNRIYLRKALASGAKALAAWEDITPLARNEWICWTISVKKDETRPQMSKGCARSSKKGCGGLAAGQAVRIDRHSVV